MAQIIDGRRVAAGVRAEAGMYVAQLAEEDISVGLAVVLVGDDPASKVYVANKQRDCESCGIKTFDHFLPEQTSQSELNSLIDSLNANPEVNGILVQLPLPAHLNEEEVIARIAPEKDVDGFHPQNLGKLLRGLDTLQACTPSGVMRLFRDYDIELEGKRAVIIGRSNIVGKPMAVMLLNANATVTVCHSRTQNLKEICKEADVLVSAIGRAKLIDRSYVKPGAVVVDVGMNRDENGKLCGDVDFDDVQEVASAITPVPGGVGPMTRAMLMLNTVQAAKEQNDYL